MFVCLCWKGSSQDEETRNERGEKETRLEASAVLQFSMAAALSMESGIGAGGERKGRRSKRETGESSRNNIMSG